MYEEILEQFRAAARAGRVFLTIHANKELKNDRLTYDDLIHCLLTGDIIEQQVDIGRREEKYLLYGDALTGLEMAVVAKPGYDQATLIITAYLLKRTDYDV